MGIPRMDDHFTCWKDRWEKEKGEKRKEIELIGHMGECSKTNFTCFNFLPQTDFEALGGTV